MVDVVRYAEKFENSAGSVTQTFPDSNLVYSPSQDYRGAWAPAVGADYAHLFSGTGELTKEVGFEVVAGVIWGTSGSNADTQFDAVASKCKSIGLGKLYVIDQAGARRWCWAISLGRPGYQSDPDSLYNIPYSLRFARFSDWFDTAATTATAGVVVNYQSITITNAGNAPVKTGFVLTLTAAAAGGFSNVIITNVTTGEQIRWNGYVTWIGAVLRIDTSALSITLLPDPGLVIGGDDSYVGEGGIGGPGVYVDAYPLSILGALQSGFLTLAPGANTVVIQVDGTANYTYAYSFYGAWE